ncbi:MAG TPA: phage holin family protein [Terriglobales bacterium]
MSERANFAAVQPPLSGNHERSLRNILREIAAELTEFLDTRVQMAKSELQETLGAVKTAVPLAVGAVGLFLTGLLLITLALVSITASAFAGSPYAWFYAFLIVGFCWIAFGAVSAFFALNQFRGRGQFPKRTIEVLKADKAWLQNEARGSL